MASFFRNSFIHKTITKWTTNSFTNYPSKQYSLIITRYINSETLFNEINASINKLKENNASQSQSNNTQQTYNTHNKSKPIKKPKPTNKTKPSKTKQIMPKNSVSLVDTTQSTLTQRNNTYLTQTQSSKSLFDKYDVMAHNLNQQNKELDTQLTKHKNKKENIDKYIRKEFTQKQKLKQQKFRDPIDSELDYYDLPLPELISRDNLTKHKPPKPQDTIVKYDESELTVAENGNEGNDSDAISTYDEMFNGLIAENTNKPSKKMREKELMKRIDWTKLENYVELNGWNNFAEFLNETESENENQTKYTIPSFLSEIPKQRTTLDRPKARILGNEDKAFKRYKINQRVQIEPFKFMNSGNVCVLVNDKHYGFIKKHNLPISVKIGEYHTGYVCDINHWGQIEVMMEKPNFWSRMSECQRRIINVLKYCNGTVEISDKSDAEIIKRMFEMSKKNFKKALGMLLKNRVIEIFNESDGDVPCKIVLKRLEFDLKHYDIGKEIEERMWKSKPMWEYGVTAPPFGDVLPDEMKDRNKKTYETYARKFTVRKKA